MNTDEWRLEQIRQIIENFLTSDAKTPSIWAMQALGRICEILDISDAEVRKRMP